MSEPTPSPGTPDKPAAPVATAPKPAVPAKPAAGKKTDDGQIVVDKSRKFQKEIGQWEDTDSYIQM